jgi:hypothetical protein
VPGAKRCERRPACVLAIMRGITQDAEPGRALLLHVAEVRKFFVQGL